MNRVINLTEKYSDIGLNDNYLNIKLGIERKSREEEGVLFSQGDESGGFSLYIKRNRLVFHINYYGRERYEVRSISEVPLGKSEIGFEFTPRVGFQGFVRTRINDRIAGESLVSKLDKIGSISIGEDPTSAASYQYSSPFRFEAKINILNYENYSVDYYKNAQRHIV